MVSQNGHTNGANGSHGFAKPKQLMREPLKYSGSLDEYEYFEVSPIIGREYTNLQLSDIQHDEQKLKDLAIIISERGVVFLRDQTIEMEAQLQLTDALGRLAGRPEDHSLHVHPLYRSKDNIGYDDEGHTHQNVYVINSEAQKKMYKSMSKVASTEPKDLGREWHSDCTFEECPADYSVLKLVKVPSTGGDTLWASGCEIYDRMSPAYRAFLENLTATCAQPVFRTAATEGNFEVMSPRGSPANKGDDFAPCHPVIRTNPVTGFKSMFAGVGLHVTKINGVTSYEDSQIREYMMRLITRNHDCIARLKWTPNAMALWDNRSTFHAATPDSHLVPNSVRTGVRASSIGEKPYLDPASTGRREALGMSVN